MGAIQPRTRVDGITEDGRRWELWTPTLSNGKPGLPRATNAFFSRERLDLPGDELRAKDAEKPQPEPVRPTIDCFRCVQHGIHDSMHQSPKGIWVCENCGRTWYKHEKRLDWNHRCPICHYPMVIEFGKVAYCQHENTGLHRAAQNTPKG